MLMAISLHQFTMGPRLAQGRLHARAHFFSWQLVILSALLQFEATALRHSRTSVVPSAAVVVSCEQQRWWDSHQAACVEEEGKINVS